MAERAAGAAYQMLILASVELHLLLLQLCILCSQRLELALHLRLLLRYGGELDLHVLDSVFMALFEILRACSTGAALLVGMLTFLTSSRPARPAGNSSVASV